MTDLLEEPYSDFVVGLLADLSLKAEVREEILRVSHGVMPEAWPRIETALQHRIYCGVEVRDLRLVVKCGDSVTTHTQCPKPHKCLAKQKCSDIFRTGQLKSLPSKVKETLSLMGKPLPATCYYFTLYCNWHPEAKHSELEFYLLFTADGSPGWAPLRIAGSRAQTRLMTV